MNYVTKWDCVNGGHIVPGAASFCNVNTSDNVVLCCDNDNLCNRNHIPVLPMETAILAHPTSITKAFPTEASGTYVAEDISRLVRKDGATQTRAYNFPLYQLCMCNSGDLLCRG